MKHKISLILGRNQIPPNAEIFRAARGSGWVKQPEKLYEAFLLRPKINEKKLSVLTEANCSKSFCAAIRFNTCYGEIVLKVENILKLGLNVIYDPEPDIPHHASILGLPQYKDETEAEARSIAIEIAETVIRIQPQKFKKK